RFSEQCAARTKTVNAVLAQELEDDFSLELTPEQLVAEYEKLPLLRQHIDKVEKAMFAALHSGKKVPGYKLVEGRGGNRTWKDAKKVASKYGIALMKQVLLTPTEAIKVVPEEELKDFITRKPGAPCVTTVEDKRPEWKNVTEDDLEA
ncbi:TPA: DUF2800 domain-containing protein, partial [Salmonella enterica]|nr:DUF2800 domain-containing protein [Salmonella enterica]